MYTFTTPIHYILRTAVSALYTSSQVSAIRCFLTYAFGTRDSYVITTLLVKQIDFTITHRHLINKNGKKKLDNTLSQIQVNYTCMIGSE